MSDEIGNGTNKENKGNNIWPPLFALIGVVIGAVLTFMGDYYNVRAQERNLDFQIRQDIVDKLLNADNVDERELAITLVSPFDKSDDMINSLLQSVINVSARQFHRTVEQRDEAARLMAALYHIKPDEVTNAILDQIIMDSVKCSYCYANSVNKTVIVALKKITNPMEWKCSDEQFAKLKSLRRWNFRDCGRDYGLPNQAWQERLEMVVARRKPSDYEKETY
ncbi:hypothetical protein [Owenweeksia hongkongensis]|uniref:hypothetical protein n=1 Tax=Owenweeksia hongkongensis TaxID=253245 RepID=UPI003A8ED71A